MDKQEKIDRLYLKMAFIWAENSYAIRRKVGCLIVKNNSIISDGYNGTPSGFPNVCEYAVGYGGEEYDWLLFASECLGNSSVPVGDYHWTTQNLNGYRIARLGGSWTYGAVAGGFCWYLNTSVGYHYRDIGGRLMYIPTAKG